MGPTTSGRALFASVRNVAIVGWREAPLPEDIREWHRFGQTMARTHPAGSACVDIVVRGTPNFSDETRAAALRFASDPRIFTLGIAHAILLPGMAGTAVRTFINTILLVARPPAPAKAFGDLSGTVDWLLPKLESWTRGELLAACEDVRARLVALG